MKTIAVAVMTAWVAASVFGATDAERIEALEKKVAELSRKVGAEAPLSVREAHTWHRARLMGLECAVRQYELKVDQYAQLSENAKAVYREELAAHSNRLLTAERGTCQGRGRGTAEGGGRATFRRAAQDSFELYAATVKG